MIAASRGHIGIVRKLLNWKEIDANLCDAEGGTALRLAVERVQPEVVRVLLSSHKVDPNIGQPFFWISYFNTPGKAFADQFVANPMFNINCGQEEPGKSCDGRRPWVELAINFQLEPLKVLLSRNDCNLMARGREVLEE